MRNVDTGQGGILRSMYPEIAAGGYSRVDGSIEFYSRVNSLLTPSMDVLDWGAGRGEWVRDPVIFRRDLRTLKGKVREVVGVDIDPVVATNPSIDRYVISPDFHSIPLPDQSIDLIVADHTFEHLDMPAETAAEIERVLRPNGWVCARTPNRWGYIALSTSLIPNGRHAHLLARFQPARESADVFPTRYRLNTRRALRTYFPADRYDDFSYFWSGEPSYFGQSRGFARFLRSSSKHLPPAVQPKIFVFMRKRADPPGHDRSGPAVSS